MLKNILQERVILPLSDIITGQKVSRYLKFLLTSKSWNREQIDNFQNERLKRLIEYSYENVPFYHDEMRKRGITPSDIQSKEDLYKLPVINKEIMRKEGIERFTSQSMPKSKMILKSSSGSTGQPFKYYATKLSYSVNLAANLRGWYNFGWRLGDKYVKISQNPRKSFIKRIQDSITGNLYLATADLSDEHLHEMMQQIEDYKPLVIRSYPDPLYLMAKYRLEHKSEFSFCPKVITTTGNVLHENVRHIIEEAFGCKIFDAYASEGNSNVFECPTHCGYHSSEEYGITEFLDEQNNPVKQGTGRIITTDLWNYAHPFIRYDVQDLAEIDSEPCPCGNEHKRIKKILGRDNELLIAPSGKKYCVHHFTVFFESTVTPELKDSIDQFQFIQHKNQDITIKLVVNKKYDSEVERFLTKYWCMEFKSNVDIQIVDKIPIMNNNKRKFIIIEK